MALSKIFKGTPQFQLKLCQSSFKNLKYILEKEKSQTVKQHAVEAILYVILNPNMSNYLILPEIESHVFSWMVSNCMFYASYNEKYKKKLGYVFGSILSASQSPSLKIIKGFRVSYEKCLEYLFLLSSNGRLTAKKSKLSALMGAVNLTGSFNESLNEYDLGYANAISCGNYAVEKFIRLQGPDHLESHLRIFLISLCEYSTLESSYKKAVNLMVNFLPEKSIANSIIKKTALLLKKYAKLEGSGDNYWGFLWGEKFLFFAR